MHSYILFLFLTTSLVKTCFSIQCYSCNGIYDKLDNKTCSIITQNDSCFTTIDHSIWSGNWIVAMGGFNNDSMPYNYVKPKSGSSFFDQYWLITGYPNNGFQMQTRFFCYKDFCNPLSMVPNYINAQLKYPSYNFEQNITQCLVCNASDYNSAKQCGMTQKCNLSCSLTANKYMNDLYNYGSWESWCLIYPIQNGYVRLQYEVDTKVFNVFTEIICLNSICGTFDFTNDFLNGIQLIF